MTRGCVLLSDATRALPHRNFPHCCSGYGTEAAAASIGLAVHELPNFVLAIESEELGITAGLQDRVVQVRRGYNFNTLNLPPQLGTSAAGGRVHEWGVADWALCGRRVVIGTWWGVYGFAVSRVFCSLAATRIRTQTQPTRTSGR